MKGAEFMVGDSFLSEKAFEHAAILAGLSSTVEATNVAVSRLAEEVRESRAECRDQHTQIRAELATMSTKTVGPFGAMSGWQMMTVLVAVITSVAVVVAIIANGINGETTDIRDLSVISSVGDNSTPGASEIHNLTPAEAERLKALAAGLGGFLGPDAP
tara:strand:+ start:183 stop:659 length:477 start_codon:yes stop_codon:yes gene_type:complete